MHFPGINDQTEHFTISEPQDQRIDDLELYKMCLSTSALRLYNSEMFGQDDMTTADILPIPVFLRGSSLNSFPKS